MKRTARGFSIIELIVIIGVVMTITVLGMVWLNSERKMALREDMAVQQAMEMGTLTRALTDYLTTSTGLPSEVDTPFDVTVADLAGASLVPATFAQRFGATEATTPLGQLYVLRATKTNQGYRGIVYAQGAPNAGILSRIGMEATPQALELYWKMVATRLRGSHHVQAGIVKAGHQAIDAASSSFEYDLGTLITEPLAQPASVALANFEDLNVVPAQRVSIDPASLPGGTGGGIGGGNAQFDGKECRLTTDEPCEAGETESWTHSMCDGWQDDDNGVSRTSVVSLGSNVINIQRNVVGNSNLQLMSGNFGLKTATSPQVSVHMGRVLGSNTITSSPSVGPLMATTDHWAVVSNGPDFVTNSTTLTPDVNTAPGTTFSRIATLPHCGGSNEVDTPVYRVETGSIRYFNLLYDPPQNMGPGTQFLSVSEKSPSWSLSWNETVTQGGFSATSICRSKYLATSSVNGPADNRSADYRCPLRTSAAKAGPTNDVTTAYPIRAFDHLVRDTKKMRYCCK